MFEQFSGDSRGQASGEEHKPSVEEETHQEVLSSISGTILRASLQAIYASGRERQAASQLVGDLMRARDKYIVGMAKARNPGIEVIDEKSGLYRAGSSKVYGSLWAVMDATPKLEDDAILAELLSNTSATAADSVDSVAGESLQPRAWVESEVHLAGSAAQDRVQQYATDLDFSEDLFIQAATEDEAVSLLVNKLQGAAAVRQTPQGTQPAYQVLPQRIWVHPRGYASQDQREWLPHEIARGRKRFYDEQGQLRELTFADALRRAGKIQVEYYIVSADQAFKATQMCYVSVANEQGVRHLGTDPSPGRAYQDVYFDQHANPEQQDTNNPELLISYLTQMADQLRLIEKDGQPDGLKALKRFYNFSKAAGDFETLEQLEELFKRREVRLYQIAKRLPTAYAVWEQTRDRRPLDTLYTELGNYIQAAPELSPLLQQRLSASTVGSISTTLIERLVEPAVADFLAEHPMVSQKLDQAKQFSRIR